MNEKAYEERNMNIMNSITKMNNINNMNKMNSINNMDEKTHIGNIFGEDDDIDLFNEKNKIVNQQIPMNLNKNESNSNQSVSNIFDTDTINNELNYQFDVNNEITENTLNQYDNKLDNALNEYVIKN